jgi:hypothetical protein
MKNFIFINDKEIPETDLETASFTYDEKPRKWFEVCCTYPDKKLIKYRIHFSFTNSAVITVPIGGETDKMLIGLKPSIKSPFEYFIAKK